LGWEGETTTGGLGGRRKIKLKNRADVVRNYLANLA
jgi:hypothetical protein